MHNIEYLVFEEKEDKKNILTEAQLIADNSGDYGGQIHNIRWYDNTICDNRDAAEKFIDEHDKHWYDQLGVKFFSYPTLEDTKKIKDFRMKARELKDKIYTLNHTPYVSTLKNTEFVGCKGCGSKLSTKYLKSVNRCPLCGKDMRPKTTLDKIENLKNKLKTLNENIESEIIKNQQKNKKKAVVKWLVKIEYHS